MLVNSAGSVVALGRHMRKLTSRRIGQGLELESRHGIVEARTVLGNYEAAGGIASLIRGFERNQKNNGKYPPNLGRFALPSQQATRVCRYLQGEPRLEAERWKSVPKRTFRRLFSLF